MLEYRYTGIQVYRFGCLKGGNILVELVQSKMCILCANIIAIPFSFVSKLPIIYLDTHISPPVYLYLYICIRTCPL